VGIQAVATIMLNKKIPREGDGSSGVELAWDLPQISPTIVVRLAGHFRQQHESLVWGYINFDR
jgi:hypothetical protein